MEARHQFTQPDLPDLPPPSTVVRIWNAVLQFYANPRHLDPPTRRQIRDILFKGDPAEPYSESFIDRVRDRHKQYFPVWPIPRGMRPPWSPVPLGYEEAVSEAGMELVVIDRRTGEAVDVGVDAQGRLCLLQYLPRALTALVASAGTVTVLDAMDGNLHGVIHWCLAIARMLHQTL